MRYISYFIVFTLTTSATLTSLYGINGPGWYLSSARDRVPDSRIISSAKGTNVTAENAGSLQKSACTSYGEGAGVGHEITPEIAALAHGLNNDPKKIYDFVHNKIDYVHYYGLKKGAHLTLLEKSGNDFDQSALLIALLKAAGYDTAQYQWGFHEVPYEGNEGKNLVDWIGLDIRYNL